MIRVVIADDHDIVRDGVRRILECRKEMKVVGMAGSGRETLDLLGKVAADVLILDLDMPDMDGLEVIGAARPLYPDLRILILTMHDDEEYAERVMKAGASGYALKASSPGELPDIVGKIAAGEVYVHPSIMKKTAMKLYHPVANNPVSKLSDREFQILKRLAAGVKIKDIADELNLSSSTVATHKKRLMEKTGLEKNADIVRFAIKHKIIETVK